MDWTHSRPVCAMKLFARIFAVSLGSSEDVAGRYGPHQESVAMLLTSGPSAAVSAGNSSTLATVARFRFHPCSFACRQKMLKSGGSGQLLMYWQSLDLNLVIIAVKSVVPSV